MELNHENYKKAIDKIPIPPEVDDKVIKMFEKDQLQIGRKASTQKHKFFKMPGKVIFVAATLIILSCASVFAYNSNFISKLVNPAKGLDHSDNVDVNGNEYVYTGGETLAEEVTVENLSITLSSVISDGNLTYFRFNVTTLNGESLITNTENKKSIISLQQFGDFKVYANNVMLDKESMYMLRVDSGDQDNSAQLELTIENAENSLAGKRIDIVGTNYTDTYQIINEDGSAKARETENLYEGTWDFTCNVSEDSTSSILEYTGSWEIPFLSTTLTLNSIEISNVEVFLNGKYNYLEADDTKTSNRLYLIYADGTKIEADGKMDGSQSSLTGEFERHYRLGNLVDANKVVALEYAGGLINIK